jgi:hypothetical protein
MAGARTSTHLDALSLGGTLSESHQSSIVRGILLTMTDPTPADVNPWHELFADPVAAPAFVAGDSLNDLWIPLREVGNATSDPLSAALLLLGRVASMYVKPDSWQQPYGPSLSWGEERTTIATDLVEEEIEILNACVEAIPNALLRSRVYDVLSLRADWPKRVQLALASMDALLEVPISGDGWAHQETAWSRAITSAIRYRRPAASRLKKLEQALRGAIRIRQEGFLSVRAAELLKRHRLAQDRAFVIAAKLERIAQAERINYHRAREYHGGAAAWYAWAGDLESAHSQRLLVVTSFMQEADSNARGDGAMRSAHLLESALRALRQIPRAARERLGVSALSGEIARRIRESGAATLGTMRTFTSDDVDLTEVVREARERVSGRQLLDALMLFVTAYDPPSFTKEKGSAEALITAHPLQSLFTTVTFSHDGRVVHRSGGQGGPPIYGVDPATWKQMMQAYGLRISLFTTGMIYPAFTQMINEHHLTLADFVQLVARAGIVPMDRIQQFGNGLYQGYDGDFSTALQLLSPQIENLVRHHLGNAGVTTTTISAEGIENEKGLSALMESSEVDQIFGEDIAYEIRALFCSPLGPNLRNEVAHGMLSDAAANSANALYAWWFVLRMVLTQFWNRLHDTEAAEAREPTRPGDDRDEQ